MIIGSRKSDLAVIQAESVAKQLQEQNPNLEVHFFQRPSLGDLNLDMNLNQTDSKGVFTADFIEHLRNKDCDLVVHSWKDLPISENSEFVVLPGPYREDQRDMLFVKRSSMKKDQLSILTSSPRREFQLQQGLKQLLPFPTELKFESIRGNIPTRFKKFLDSDCDGFVVAKAAVDRLLSGDPTRYKEIHDQILEVFDMCAWMVLPLSEFPTAAAQGALAIELPVGSPFIAQVQKASDLKIAECVDLERQTHKSYGGGCHQAMGFSALALKHGILFYSSGKDGDKVFKNHLWKSKQTLPKGFLEEEVFVPSKLKAQRSSLDYSFSEDKASECIIARYEAFPFNAKINEKSVLWSAGVKTWKKLAAQGVWVNGTLDGLGIDHKPKLRFLDSYAKYWFTHKSAPENDLGEFQKVAAYEVHYDLQIENLKNKKIFFWSSGDLFKKALLLLPEIRNAYHVCGLGRTSYSLEENVKESQIFYALNEQDFISQVL